MRGTLSVVEREILEPIDIADARGRLVRAAVGWARHPILRCNLPAGLSRTHRWNHWCITTTTHALTMTIADVGYLGIVIVSFHELGARPVERVYVRPFGLPLAMPETPRGDIEIDVPRLRLSMRADGERMHVEGEARPLLGGRLSIDLVVERPFAHETLNVLVPWDDTTFQFTSKQQALATRGVVRVGARTHRFDENNQAFACLDFGRGRWPREIEWYWAFGSARGSRTLGFNLGGKWTDGTGVTENGFVLDGRLHKISEDLDFAHGERWMDPWRIRSRAGDRVDLVFTPKYERAVRVPLGIASADLHQMTGVFSGTLVDDAGARVPVDDVVGLAECFRGRW